MNLVCFLEVISGKGSTSSCRANDNPGDVEIESSRLNSTFPWKSTCTGMGMFGAIPQGQP